MDNLLNRAVRLALFFMAFCLLVWALMPGLRIYAAGALLGVAASWVNALLLRRRIEWVARQAASGDRRRMGLGLIGRAATVLLAAMTAYRFPDMFHLPTVLAFSFFVQIALFAFMAVSGKSDSSRKG